jgi:hypothetical protein
MQLSLGKVVARAVDLDHEILRMPGEVDDVAADRHLPPKIQLSPAKLGPQALFGQGHGAA